MILFDNPIWFRERQAILNRKRRRPIVGRLRPMVLALLWIGAAVVTTSMVWTLQAPPVTAGDMGACLNVCLECGVFIQVLYVSIRSLVPGATQLARERELQTMDTLLASPLSPSALVWGKWLVAAMPVVEEVLLAAPVLLVLGVLVTILPHTYYSWQRFGVGQFVDFELLNLAIIIFFSALGMVFSARENHCGKATLRAVMAGLAIILGTGLVDWVLSIFLTRGHDLIPITLHLCPAFAVCSIAQSLSAATTDPLNGYTWLWTLFLYGLLTMLCTTISWARVRRPTS